MTTVARTNYCTNPSPASTTGYIVNQGGGTAAMVWNSGAGYIGTGFNRVTWSANATSAGGLNAATTLNPLSVAVGDVVTSSAWVRSSKAQVVIFGTYLRNGSTQVAGTASGNSVVTLAANTWTFVTATTVAAPDTTATNSYFYCYSSGNGSFWVTGDTLDISNVLVQKNSSTTGYFDGGTAAHDNFAYQWTGTANASTSQEYYALPTVLAVAKTDAPCPRTEVTVVGLGTGTTVYTVWRTADGKRQAVRGARRRSGVDSDFVVDYEAPLNRSLSYDVEVISGTQVTQPTYPATATVASVTWWIQDPLVPSSAIPLSSGPTSDGSPRLTAAAVKALEYAASVTIIPILGSTDPVALSGNRTIGGNVDFSIYTDAAEKSTQLRNLLKQTPLLLVRPSGDMFSSPLPGLCYYSSAKPVEEPMPTTYSGTLTHWQLTGDLVAAPTMNVLVPIWTYGTVAALWATYQQAQTTLASKTYLDVLKSPSGV